MTCLIEHREEVSEFHPPIGSKLRRFRLWRERRRTAYTEPRFGWFSPASANPIPGLADEGKTLGAMSGIDAVDGSSTGT
jgi:hypothetical protein